MTQSIEKQIGMVPAIETENHLLQVSWEMLGAHSVPRSYDATLEKREGGFHGVCMNVAGNILFRVADGLMELLLVHSKSERIDSRFIGDNDFHVFAHVLRHNFADGFRRCRVNANQAQIAATLTNANDYLFLFAWQTATGLSANVGFVNFNDAVEHGLLAFYHRRADAMTEIPRRLVASESKRALNLASGNAFLGFAEKQRGREPLEQRQVRIVKHGPNGHAELIVTIFAVEQLFFGFQFDHVAFAAQALRAFREAQANEQFAALVFGPKHLMDIN